MAGKKYDKKTFDFYDSLADDAKKRLETGETIKSIASSYGACEKKLRYFLIKNKDYVPPKKNYLDKERITKRILEESYSLYSSGQVSISELASKFNVDRKKLSTMLKNEYEIEIRKDGKKVINSFFFHDIDTHTKAYWLGVMYSDGYTDGKSAFELCLKDFEHVEKFKKALGSDHKVSKKTSIREGRSYESWRISIKDKQIVSDLTRYGCNNRKSLTLSLPSLKEPLISSFLRGYFDGDGSISIKKDKNHIAVNITSGSEMILQQIGWYLKGKLSLDFVVYSDNRSENTKNLYFRKTEGAVTFLKYIYHYSVNETRIERKYNTYMKKLPSCPEANEGARL